jgi:predicted HTH transcriptional regulator
MARLTEEELYARIRAGEDSFTEFKKQLRPLDEVAADLCAFANAAGGLLLLGVADDRSIAGLADPAKALGQVDQVTLNNLEPPLSVTAQKLRIGGKDIVVVVVPQGLRLHRTNKGVYWIRTSAGRRIMTTAEVQARLQSLALLSGEEQTLGESGREDLDLPRLFARRPRLKGLSGPDLDSALRRHKILGDGGLTVFGALCFARQVSEFTPYAYISFARFRDPRMAERHDAPRDFGGVLESHLAECIDYLRSLGSSGPQDSPADLPPFEAVQEAVVNAVVHRDYLINSQVRIFLTPDRLEIRSPGRLLNTLSVETLEARTFVHAVRNPFIFAHLADQGWVSNLGQGIPMLFDVMAAAGLPAPELAEEGPDFVVRLRMR